MGLLVSIGMTVVSMHDHDRGGLVSCGWFDVSVIVFLLRCRFSRDCVLPCYAIAGKQRQRARNKRATRGSTYTPHSARRRRSSARRRRGNVKPLPRLMITLRSALALPGLAFWQTLLP
jgi:hypothetical protein